MVSANDHVHATRSAHYAGFAVDLHSSAPQRLAATMREAGYTVLWNVPGHYGHLHVQDPGFSQREASRVLNPVQRLREAAH